MATILEQIFWYNRFLNFPFICCNSTGMWAFSWRMIRFVGRFLKTSSLRYRHKKKSQGVRFVLCDAHGMSFSIERNSYSKNARCSVVPLIFSTEGFLEVLKQQFSISKIYTSGFRGEIETTITTLKMIVRKKEICFR